MVAPSKEANNDSMYKEMPTSSKGNCFHRLCWLRRGGPKQGELLGRGNTESRWQKGDQESGARNLEVSPLVEHRQCAG